MFTDNAKKNADACRFCWMCRHVCPVGLATGKEIHNARAKGLLVSMEARGTSLDEAGMGAMYECCLCKACTNDCATGFDPPIYILEARTKAVVEDALPDSVKNVFDRAIKGSIYDESPNSDLLERIKKLPNKSDVVLYIGEAARRQAHEIATAYMDLLDKSGVNFTALVDEPESGALLGELMGYVEEVKQRAQVCIDEIMSKNPKTVIVLEPTDCAFFKHTCEEWGILPEVDFITATEFMWEQIENGKLHITKTDLPATYHDPCRLARDLEESEPARKIIEAMGIDLNEMFLNRKLTKCCGGPLMSQNFSDMCNDITRVRWADVASANQDFLITSCPSCSLNFSKTKPEDMNTKDIFILLNSMC